MCELYIERTIGKGESLHRNKRRESDEWTFVIKGRQREGRKRASTDDSDEKDKRTCCDLNREVDFTFRQVGREWRTWKRGNQE